MVCQLDVPTELFVEGPDLCIILENLLNNAMEAVRQLTDEKDKWISLSVRLVKDVLLITVENPFNGAVASDGSGKLRSSKSGDHGIGLLSVKRTAEKYAGEISIHHEGGIFQVSALFCRREFLQETT